jgi:hypothetical protein
MDRNVYSRQPFGGLSWAHLRQTRFDQNQGDFENLLLFGYGNGYEKMR